MIRRSPLEFLVAVVVAGLVAEAHEYYLPIVVPPYFLNTTSGSGAPIVPEHENVSSCLLYLEGLAVTVFQTNGARDEHSRNPGIPSAGSALITGLASDDRNGKSLSSAGNSSRPTFTYSAGDAECFTITDIKPPKGTRTQDVKKQFSFNVTLHLKKEYKAFKQDLEKTKSKLRRSLFKVGPGNISFTLTFNRTSQFDWALADATAHSLTVRQGSADYLPQDLELQNDSSPATAASIYYMGVNGFGYSSYAYSFACGCTKAAFFETNSTGYYIGVSFIGMQVQPWGAVWRWKSPDSGKESLKVSFSRNVNDCVGTFTAGSLMGIIVATIFATSLIFAVLMLSSIKSHDSFDDPKKRPLVIHAN